MATGANHAVKAVPSYCYNCVSGPDLLTVKVVDGVATQILPNFAAAGIHPGDGRVCVRALGLIQKTYNPDRLRTPMKRTNPRKGRAEDPGFVPISWDEALDTIVSRLSEIRARGLRDEAGLPRVAASFGHGGTPQSYMGTFPAFLSAWGPVDYSFGSGQGVKCVHSEHLYGEFWHRGFTVAADTVLCRYIVSFGANVEVSAGVCAARRHADARIRGIKRVQIEPHLSVTAAASAEWVPIKPKADGAFMFAMLHVLLHEHPRERLDVAFLRDRTASPYLIGPNGYYLRDPRERKPLIWDSNQSSAVPFDRAGSVPSLEGKFSVADCLEIGPDGVIWRHEQAVGATAFTCLVEHMRAHSPEWAAPICDVSAATIRRVANEYLENACVGETIEIGGDLLPFRPVAVVLGKTVNNGWGGYDCCWSRTMLAALVGALEVPGGTLGTTTRLNKPLGNRLATVRPGEDGFMAANLNATDKEHWTAQPTGRNAHRTLVPLLGDSAWAQALGPTHLAWMFLKEVPPHWQRPSAPDVWFVFRSNPAISFWQSSRLVETMAEMPFVVAFAYTFDETNHMADILLPDATDLEATQLIRIGGTKFQEQFWEHHGVALRQPAVAPRGEARDFTWISTELARRCGLLESYNAAINHGTGCVPLTGSDYDFSLDTGRAHTVEEIWDAECKAATAQFSNGAEIKDLAWFKEHGFYTVPFKREDWYLYPTMVENNLRFELPYQERLSRAGRELGNRLHEHDIHWWDDQLEEYAPLPLWDDVPARWERALRKMGGDPADYPLWLITTKSMQYSAGNNAGIPLMNEVGRNMRGHGGVIINVETANRLGIRQGDAVEVRSVTGCTRGHAVLVQGIRPDTVVIIGQFDHWKTPYAKDLHFPSLNTVAPISLDLTDSTGSGSDLVRVSVRTSVQS
ncbi:MAG TPA: molybdopterin-dependent oxidoreductase [Xanthobacteraceae bacterium]|nr:molybdopterin-dependent oxidoreductase [Xanthobacteraceae bacterium]